MNFDSRFCKRLSFLFFLACFCSNESYSGVERWAQFLPACQEVWQANVAPNAGTILRPYLEEVINEANSRYSVIDRELKRMNTPDFNGVLTQIAKLKWNIQDLKRQLENLDAITPGHSQPILQELVGVKVSSQKIRLSEEIQVESAKLEEITRKNSEKLFHFEQLGLEHSEVGSLIPALRDQMTSLIPLTDYLEPRVNEMGVADIDFSAWALPSKPDFNLKLVRMFSKLLESGRIEKIEIKMLGPKVLDDDGERDFISLYLVRGLVEQTFDRTVEESREGLADNVMAQLIGKWLKADDEVIDNLRESALIDLGYKSTLATILGNIYSAYNSYGFSNNGNQGDKVMEVRLIITMNIPTPNNGTEHNL